MLTSSLIHSPSRVERLCHVDEANREYTRTFGHTSRSMERFSIGGAMLDARDEIFAVISPSEAIEVEWSVPDANSQLAQAPAGWTCAVCTYEEADSTRPSCSMCGTDNPAIVDLQQQPELLQEQATAQTAHTTPGDNPETAAQSQHQLETSHPDASAVEDTTGWACLVCTFVESDMLRHSYSISGADRPSSASDYEGSTMAIQKAHNDRVDRASADGPVLPAADCTVVIQQPPVAVQQPPELPQEQATAQTAHTTPGDNPETAAQSQHQLETSHPVASAVEDTSGWACLVCTFVESDMLRPSCSICGADRPSPLGVTHTRTLPTDIRL